ncbi:MAG: hypothetical protein IPL52_15755 [Flavobacteriales bacterium]|nr:hypothetical protein [Flavobacteriales bacterium]
MKQVLTLSLLLFGLTTLAQNTIWSHAIGNWRSGPVVYITPLIETSEAVTKPKLKEQFRAQFTELKDIPDADLDVLLFGTKEEGEESRVSLMRKYGFRKLDVVMLEARPAALPQEKSAP